MQPTVFILCVLVSNIVAAVDAAVNEMPESFELKAFLEANRAEVKVMFLTQYDETKTLEMEREDGWTILK